MKHSIQKLFDADNNVRGYRTDGLSPELQINLYIEEELAATIFDIISKMEDIPEVISDIANVNLKTMKYNDSILILLPDKNGKFPGDDDCEKMFAEQIK